MTLPEEAAGVGSVDLSGGSALVTGATRGIGREVALALGRLGSDVTVHGRDREAGRAVAKEIERSGSTARFLAADFREPEEVRGLADAVRERGELDVLVNNAGAAFDEARLLWGGVEATFAVNHLAPFLLTEELRPLLEDSGGRVVTVSSEAHRGTDLDLDSVTTTEAHSWWTAYKRSKLANVLFTYELARRLEGATATALHPGFVPATGLYRQLPAYLRPLLWVLRRMPSGLTGGLTASVEEGAETPVYLAASPAVAGVTGEYFVDREPAEPSHAARDRDNQRRLWMFSEGVLDRVAD